MTLYPYDVMYQENRMAFFRIVFATLFVIAVFNLALVTVEWCIQPLVYACSEVTKTDPINVQKRCKKWH